MWPRCPTPSSRARVRTCARRVAVARRSPLLRNQAVRASTQGQGIFARRVSQRFGHPGCRTRTLEGRGYSREKIRLREPLCRITSRPSHAQTRLNGGAFGASSEPQRRRAAFAALMRSSIAVYRVTGAPVHRYYRYTGLRVWHVLRVLPCSTPACIACTACEYVCLPSPGLLILAVRVQTVRLVRRDAYRVQGDDQVGLVFAPNRVALRGRGGRCRDGERGDGGGDMVSRRTS